MTVLGPVPGSAPAVCWWECKDRADVRTKDHRQKAFESSGTLALLLRCGGAVPATVAPSKALEQSGGRACSQRGPSCMSHHRGCQYRGDTVAGVKVV